MLFGLGRLFPISILSFHYALTTLALIGLRLVAKSIYLAGTQTKSDAINLLIFGCGDSGIMTKNAFQQEQNGKFKVVGFLTITQTVGVNNFRIFRFTHLN